jgi:DNA-directed RNA polymerase subunit L
MQGYDFIFEDSDDTLGNLIQTFGLKDKDIKYIGYNIPHILDKKLFIRISLGDDISRSIYEKKVIDIGNEIIKSIQKLKKEYIDAV